MNPTCRNDCSTDGARLLSKWLDLDAIVADRALSAGPRSSCRASDLNKIDSNSRPRCRIRVAYDAAFHFYYEDNLNRLRSLGAEIVNFSPIHDRGLPEVDGLYFGGGYPKAYARELSSIWRCSAQSATSRFAVA